MERAGRSTARGRVVALLWVGMIAGFGLDFRRYLHEAPPAPRITAVHAAVFTGWLLLLTAQIVLVLRDRVARHRRLGWVAAGWACLMAVVGPWAALASEAVTIHDPAANPQILAFGGFFVLLAWAMVVRRQPAAHRRLMMLATTSLAAPGFARILYFLPQPTSAVHAFVVTYYGNLLLIGLVLAWDWWRGRVLRCYALSAAALVIVEFAASWLYFWEPWKALTTKWVEAFARV